MPFILPHQITMSNPKTSNINGMTKYKCIIPTTLGLDSIHINHGDIVSASHCSCYRIATLTIETQEGVSGEMFLDSFVLCFERA